MDRRFGTLLVCYLIAYFTIQLSYPFVALYLRDLGESDTSAIAWSGAINTSMPLLIGLSAAVWGNLADRVGLKLMAIRALVVAVLVFGSLLFVHSAWQVFGLFVLYGLAGSPPPAFTALAAATLSVRRASLGMGLMQTMQFVGVSVGPLVGVVLIGLAGFHGAFAMAALVMFATLLLTVAFVREPSRRFIHGVARLSLRQGFSLVGRAPRLRSPMVAMTAFQASLSASGSLLPLHLQHLSGGGSGVSLSVGLVLAATGLASAVGSVALAWRSGQLGAGRIALVGLVLAGIGMVPCAFISDVGVFMAVRCAIGFVQGGVLPALQSVLIDMTQRDSRVAGSIGTVQGLNQGAMWAGSAAGAAGASIVAAQFGLATMFLLAAAFLLVAAAWWWYELREQSLAVEPAYGV